MDGLIIKSLSNHAVALGLQCGSMLDQPQLTWLFALAHLAPDGPGCEIGTYQGGSLACWGQARRGRGKLFVVDSFGPGGKWERAYDDYVHTLELSNLTGDVTTIRKSSLDGAADVPGGLAFCFIDGDHGADGIPHDLKVWPHKIKRGGVLVFHDYISSNANAVVGVSVDAWHDTAKWHDLGMIGSARAYQRPVKG